MALGRCFMMIFQGDTPWASSLPAKHPPLFFIYLLPTQGVCRNQSSPRCHRSSPLKVYSSFFDDFTAIAAYRAIAIYNYVLLMITIITSAKDCSYLTIHALSVNTTGRLGWPDRLSRISVLYEICFSRSINLKSFKMVVAFRISSNRVKFKEMTDGRKRGSRS